MFFLPDFTGDKAGDKRAVFSRQIEKLTANINFAKILAGENPADFHSHLLGAGRTLLELQLHQSEFVANGKMVLAIDRKMNTAKADIEHGCLQCCVLPAIAGKTALQFFISFKIHANMTAAFGEISFHKHPLSSC